MTFNKGQAVKHKKFGRGIVLSNRYNGFEYFVGFRNLRLWIPKDQLSEDEHGLFVVESSAESVIDNILKKDSIARTKPKVLQAKKRDSASIILIESFRMGIVPDSLVEKWTVGRNEELKSIKEWLSEESEGSLIIEGSYGSGKSHLLRFLHEQALNEGWAVSLCHFDPSEATAAFPKKLYRKITDSFHINIDHRILDFRSFFEIVAAKIVKENSVNPVAEHRYLGPLLNDLTKDTIDENHWDWISGREGIRGKFGSLYDYTTSANIYCNILSCIGHILSSYMDKRGFLLLLDEVETSRSMFYYYQFCRGLNFFRGLSLVANDDPILLEDQIVKINNVKTGDKTSLVYSGHLPIPYTYNIPSNLKVVFAMTPNSLTREFMEFRSTIPIMRLDSLRIEDLQNLFKRFVEHYCNVYEINIGSINIGRAFRLLLDHNGYQSTRQFIKSMVEFMDFVRYYPTLDAEELLFG